jgi:outer membrane murein-binding lipoprotein Lpp
LTFSINFATHFLTQKQNKMKKLTYTLAAFSIGALMLVGCAKENNKYDKILTEGAWTVSTVNEVNTQTQFDDYSDATPDETQITTTTTSTAAGVQTMSQESVDKVVGSADATEFTEVKYDFTGTMTFGEGGDYTSNVVSKPTHYKHSMNGVVDFDNSITVTESTSNMTDIWNWENTADTKTQISFGGSTYNVKLEKDKVTLTKSTSSQDKSYVSPTQVRTSTITDVVTTVLTR